MKGFLLFAGPDHYPVGGWGDFIGDFDSIEEACAACPKSNRGEPVQWRQVVANGVVVLAESREGRSWSFDENARWMFGMRG